MDDKQKEDYVLAKLKFIGQIRLGEKISTRTLNVQTNNILTSINRSLWNHECREDTFDFLYNTIKSSFDLLHKYGSCKNSFEKVVSNHILTDLENCKYGLQNIKGTYSDDIMFSCKIDTLLQEIDARLAGFNDRQEFKNVSVEDPKPEKRIDTSKNTKNT